MQNLVFFDCECANTKGGIGKICSLGYVVSDENFNVIEKDDIVMNPECEFDWYLFSGKGGCSLAYTKEYFREQPNFPKFYERIKSLFCAPEEPLVFGFAVGNDVGFVNSACNRYKRPFINFRAFDLAKLFSSHFEQTKKLSEWTNFFGEKEASLTAHKSVDDAMMTLLCLKHFCEKTGKTAVQIFEENRDFITSTQLSAQEAAERAKRKRAMEKIKNLYDRKNPRYEYDSVLDMHFEFDKSVFKDTENSVKLARKIFNNGGILHRHLKPSSGYIVFAEKPADYQLENAGRRGLKTITVQELNSILE